VVASGEPPYRSLLRRGETKGQDGAASFGSCCPASWASSCAILACAFWSSSCVLSNLVVAPVDAKCAPSAKHTTRRTSWLHTCRESRDVPVNFPWKLTKDKVVKYQSLELAGWYQTVPYLRLQSQMGWHIAIESCLPINWNHSGALRRKK
jgi:hypothetical protein